MMENGRNSNFKALLDEINSESFIVPKSVEALKDFLLKKGDNLKLEGIVNICEGSCRYVASHTSAEPTDL